MQEKNTVIERILITMGKRGVSKGWIADKLKWPPSKVTKIFNGSQKLSTDELIEIAFALNENPALFLSADLKDIRDKYQEKRMLSSIFNDIYKNKDCPDELVSYMEVLLPNTVEFITKAYEEGRVVESSYRYKRIYKHKDGRKPNPYTPNPRVVIVDNNSGHIYGKQFTVGYWFTTDKQSVYLAIHSSVQEMVRASDRDNRFRVDMQHLFRLFIKDIIKEDDDFEFVKDDFDKRSTFSKGVITCKKYSLSEVPFEDILYNDLIIMYENYLKFLDFLSKQATNTFQSVVEDNFDLVSENSSNIDIEKVSMVRTEKASQTKRRKDLERIAADRENYTCENNSQHTTFIDRRNGKPYIQVASLIPTSVLDKEGLNEVPDNMVCLCPNCNAKLLYGDANIREEMLLKLYMKHKESLKEQGVEISMMQLLKWNNLG